VGRHGAGGGGRALAPQSSGQAYLNRIWGKVQKKVVDTKDDLKEAI